MTPYDHDEAVTIRHKVERIERERADDPAQIGDTIEMIGFGGRFVVTCVYSFGSVDGSNLPGESFDRVRCLSPSYYRIVECPNS